MYIEFMFIGTAIKLIDKMSKCLFRMLKEIRRGKSIGKCKRARSLVFSGLCMETKGSQLKSGC